MSQVQACCSVQVPATLWPAVPHFAWQHWQSPCPDPPDSLRACAVDADGYTVQVVSLCQDTFDPLCTGADAANIESAAIKVFAARAVLPSAGALPVPSIINRQPGTRKDLRSQSWECQRELKLSEKLALQHVRAAHAAKARVSSQQASSSQLGIRMETVEQQARWKGHKVISFGAPAIRAAGRGTARSLGRSRLAAASQCAEGRQEAVAELDQLPAATEKGASSTAACAARCNTIVVTTTSRILLDLSK